MRHLIFRIFLILLVWSFLFIYTFPRNSYWIEVPFSGKDYKLWLDLQWGIELDYKIDLEEAKQDSEYNQTKENEIIEWLKTIIDKRIETLKINDSVITSANYGWEKHIIVQIPLKWNNSFENKENIKKAKEAIWKVVKIQFKEENLNINEENTTQEALNKRKDIANEFKTELENWEKFDVLITKYPLLYENTEGGTIIKLKEIFEEKEFVNGYNEAKKLSWEEWFLFLDWVWTENVKYVFINKQPSIWTEAKDSQGRVLNDKYFVKSSVQYNDAFRPMIELVFNSEWADIFAELSERLVWKPMAIFVWGELLTAPNINEPIYWWKAVITWNYTVEEAKELSQNINTWVVPAPIYLTSEKTIDSKLWSKSLEKLVIAWIIWFIIIFTFLIVIYRFAWLMATIALLSYVVIVLSLVKTFWVVLTLASIAWLILSIGMAIDANILIFERIKSELKDWKNIKDATTIWFKKSWSAIWDSNVTSFIVAMILFIFGINLIKWFGLILAIWIIVSLFSAMWISRILINLLAETWVKENMFIWMKK